MDNFETLVSVLIKDEAEGIQNHERIIDIGETPGVLISHAGFTQRKMIIKASAISKIHFDHGINQSLICRIPELLKNPKSIFRSATHPDSAVVFTLEYKSSAPILIVVKKDRTIGRDILNECASMYAKEGTDPEAKWTKDGLLLWKSRGKNRSPL